MRKVVCLAYSLGDAEDAPLYQEVSDLMRNSEAKGLAVMRTHIIRPPFGGQDNVGESLDTMVGEDLVMFTKGGQ